MDLNTYAQNHGLVIGISGDKWIDANTGNPIDLDAVCREELNNSAAFANNDGSGIYGYFCSSNIRGGNDNTDVIDTKYHGDSSTGGIKCPPGLMLNPLTGNCDIVMPHNDSLPCNGTQGADGTCYPCATGTVYDGKGGCVGLDQHTNPTTTTAGNNSISGLFGSLSDSNKKVLVGVGVAVVLLMMLKK